uniref:Uncharacterized protein n=1 Tax=Anguilla anguilla TaxID=7936 RepID=A0A0E9VVT2_ANGAN
MVAWLESIQADHSQCCPSIHVVVVGTGNVVEGGWAVVVTVVEIVEVDGFSGFSCGRIGCDSRCSSGGCAS